MRFSFISFLPFLCTGCFSPTAEPDRALNFATQWQPEKLPYELQPIFVFDEVDHYFTSISGDSIMGIERVKDESSENQLFVDIMLDYTPEDITDTSFIPRLVALGYQKSDLADSLLDDVNEIFIEEYAGEGGSGCIAFYRDILIFRKNGKVSGIAKVCFGCEAIQLQGHRDIRNYYFSFSGFEKLAILLNRNHYIG